MRVYGHMYMCVLLVVSGCGTFQSPTPEPTPTAVIDQDGDGLSAAEDCDDLNSTLPKEWYQDADGDGFGVETNVEIACEQPDGYVSRAGDCHDNLPSVYPGATELCDRVDQNCNNLVDEGLNRIVYLDADQDGFGNRDSFFETCFETAFFVSDNTDCDDLRADVSPISPELCDDLDNDCDDLIDEDANKLHFWPDTDGDGYGTSRGEYQLACTPPEGYVINIDDCDDANPYVHKGAQEVCNGIDDDCDLQTDEGGQTVFYHDADHDGFGTSKLTQQACFVPDGYSLYNTDCDDGDNAIHPYVSEICNSLDDDCDGEVDEDAVDRKNYYQDLDGDGYAGFTGIIPVLSCEPLEGYARYRGDCNDFNEDINPEAIELCDGIDNNCDWIIDPSSSQDAKDWYFDFDQDGYGDMYGSPVTQCYGFVGYVDNADDCDDENDQINPDYPENEGVYCSEEGTPTPTGEPTPSQTP